MAYAGTVEFGGRNPVPLAQRFSSTVSRITSALVNSTASIAKNTRSAPRANWMRDSSAGFLSSWRPALRDARDDVRSSWGLAAARSIDSLRNSGWLAGSVLQLSADTIGAGLRLNSTPDVEALGWTDDFAHEWTRKVERRWRAWSNNPLECDARGKRTIADLTDAAMLHHFAFGEVAALLPEIRRPESRSAVKVMMISPHRMSSDTIENERLFHGVRLDGNGLPVGYRFCRRVNGYDEQIEFKARSSKGRQQVIHVFDGAPDQVRGITPLAPVLKVLRQYDQLADATLTAALIQTIIAATLKSPDLSEEAFDGLQGSAEGADGSGGPAVPEEIAAYMTARASWWQNRSIDLGIHGKVQSLFPGETFELHSAKHPSDTYLPFSKNLLREVARCLGTTYESLTGDYEGATYSSVRMGTSSMWFVTMRRRQRIAIPFVQGIYSAWLEEEIREGRVPFPGGYEKFLQLRTETTAAEWFGPAKPTADDLKTAKAQTERLTNGTTSLAYECAEYGLDPETVMEQRAQDRKLAEKFGLPDPYALIAALANRAGQSPPDNEDPPPPKKRLN